MGGSASTRRIAPRAKQPPCLLEPVTAEVCNSQAPTPSATALSSRWCHCVTSANAEPEPTP